MKAIAVIPGKPDSIHLREAPKPSVDDVPVGRGVLVRVLRVGRGDYDSLPLRTIASQLPARSDVGSDDNDIGERLFDALTVRDAPDEKVVLVIDDAELLQPDVLAYLSLMSKLRGMLPQVLLVGRPEFWSATLHATSSNIAAETTLRLGTHVAVLVPLRFTLIELLARSNRGRPS